MWILEKMKEYKTVEESFMVAQKLSSEAKEVILEDESLVAILDTMIQRSY